MEPFLWMYQRHNTDAHVHNNGRTRSQNAKEVLPATQHRVRTSGRLINCTTGTSFEMLMFCCGAEATTKRTSRKQKRKTTHTHTHAGSGTRNNKSASCASLGTGPEHTCRRFCMCVKLFPFVPFETVRPLEKMMMLASSSTPLCMSGTLALYCFAFRLWILHGKYTGHRIVARSISVRIPA